MRGLRSFLLLLVVALGLGAYVYFVESKRDPSSGDSREKVFASLEADAIQEVAVKSEKGERTALKKADGNWQIVEPVTAPSDSAEVSGITSNLANARSAIASLTRTRRICSSTASIRPASK